jgi:branched-chain amino acid transport system ATP-binding protein
MTALRVENLSIHFGGVHALKDVSFSVAEGAIYALIGPNGAGKTTLFNIIAGVYECSHGDVFLFEQKITGLQPAQLARRGLTRTFQNLQIFFRMTAVENVAVGRHIHERRNALVDALGLPTMHRQRSISRSASLALLDRVDLTAVADRPASDLPYGALKRLEIARALAIEPRVLMLDEPVAGCNATETAEVAAVIRQVADAGVTVVLVEHDMGLVMKLADRIHVLERGKTLAEGSPAEIRSHAAVIDAYLGIPKEAAHADG